MKSIILGFALFLLIAGVKSNAGNTFKANQKACSAKSNISEDKVMEFYSVQMKDKPSDDFKCHLKCLMEKRGSWNANGFDKAVPIKNVQKSPYLKKKKESVEIIEQCKDYKGTNDCDTAYLIQKCIVDKHATLK